MGATTAEPFIHRAIEAKAKAPAPSVTLITTAPITLWTFLRHQMANLENAGFVISAVSSPGEHLAVCRSSMAFPVESVPMRRAISPLADLVAIRLLTALLIRNRPVIVQTHTPKAGLLGMIASFLARVPIRIYTVNGLVWETESGIRRSLLRIAEKVAIWCSTDVLCVSESVRRKVSSSRARVLGRGGSHGVNLERFRRQPERRSTIRKSLGIPEKSIVLGFVGRIVGDKGIDDLAVAWTILRQTHADVYLLLAGAEEPDDPISSAASAALHGDSQVIWTRSFRVDMPEVYSAMDCLVLPTYREGLPNVLLEAAAMEVPAIATRVTGCVDVIEHCVTGLLVPAHDPNSLHAAILSILNQPDRAQAMARKARAMVECDFSERIVSTRLAQEYRRLLIARGLSQPEQSNKKEVSAS